MLDLIPQAAECGQGGQRIAPESNDLGAVAVHREPCMLLFWACTSLYKLVQAL